MEPFWGPFWGPFFGTLISQPGSIHCIRVRLCLTFGTPHFLIRVPKNGSKNGLRMDPQMDHFGTHFMGTKIGQFLDLKKGTIARKWGYQKWSRVGHVCNVVTPVGKWGSPKMDPKTVPNLGIQNQWKTKVFLIKIDQNGSIFGPPNRSILGPQNDT